MSPTITLALVLLGIAATASAASLPEKFYGTFDLDHSENFDEYLTAKGYGWFTRKLVNLATFKKIWSRNANKNLFDYSNLTSKKDVHYKNIEFGKPFTAEGLDSTQHEVTNLFQNLPVSDSLWDHLHPQGWTCLRAPQATRRRRCQGRDLRVPFRRRISSHCERKGNFSAE